MSPVTKIVQTPSPENGEQLRALVRQRLESACDSKPSWQWQTDERVELDEMARRDPEQVRRLLFGDLRSVEEELQNNSWEYLSQRREELVKEALVEVIDDELASVIADFAERNDLDSGDLAEELKEDSAFKPENLEVPYIDTEFSYQGQVAVVAQLDLTIGFEPKENLFKSLRALRVPTEQFLVECRAMIERRELTLQEPGPFDAKVLSLAGEGALTLYDAYASAFQAAQRSSAEEGLYASITHSKESVVDPARLVEAMYWWDGEVELHLHTRCSETTVALVSKDLAAYEFDPLETALEVREGVLAPEETPDAIFTELPIAASLDVCAGQFRVLTERPLKIDSEPVLSADLLFGCMLVRDMDRLVRDPAMFNKESTLNQLLKLADKLAPFRIETFLEHLPNLKSASATQTVKARLEQNAAAPLSEHERTHGLFECLDDGGRAGSAARQKAFWLIDKGADVNFALVNGLTPLMLAARAQDSAVLGSLLSSGADVHTTAKNEFTGDVDNALSICVRTLAGYRNNPAAIACMADLLRAGAALPPLPLRADVFNFDVGSAHLSPILLSTLTGRVELVRRTVEDASNRGVRIDQGDLDEALLHAATAKDVEVACVLLDSGADLQAMVSDKEGNVHSLVDLVRLREIENRGNAHQADDFFATINAYRARQAIARVRSGPRSTPA